MRPLRIESFDGIHDVATVEELHAVAQARTPEDEARLYVTPPEESRPLLVIEITGQHAYLHFFADIDAGPGEQSIGTQLEATVRFRRSEIVVPGSCVVSLREASKALALFANDYAKPTNIEWFAL